jgi:ferrous iron transport protein B
MGLTKQSTGAAVLENELCIKRALSDEKIIALAGNPNVGKSTVFNSLTGLNQHTGNWPGKTVASARGIYRHKNKTFIMVDLPGTYSLMAKSAEEEAARDFVCFGKPDATVVVTDATCLERNLNLVLQTLEITDRVVVCANLIDEAKRKKISIDCRKLSDLLGVPVIPTNARDSEGLTELMDAVYDMANGNTRVNPVRIKYDNVIEHAIDIILPQVREIADGKINDRWVALKLLEEDATLLTSLNRHLGFNIMENTRLKELVGTALKYLADNGLDPDRLRDKIVSGLIHTAEDICSNTMFHGSSKYNDADRKIDRVVMSRIFGVPIMLGLLGLILWLTITGANYPSQLLAWLLFRVEDMLTVFFDWAGMPSWVHGIMVLGVYRTLAWVISVMLPPMAIFFPLFTLLEDLGYLPRVAFNLDNFFKKACAHGKQALTMCMGFGCNAAGVIGCRIIDSPRERLIAIITNNFVPCNGRFPTLIAIITMFFAGNTAGLFRSAISTLLLTGVIVLGIVITLLVSKVLSKTILKGLPSSFALELPPYRKPQIGRVIVRSVFDRTLFVLGRAVAVAAPAGLLIWLLANINLGGISILAHCAGFLEPFARLFGLDGYILMAFILGFPANEIVVPIIIMSYMASGSMLELDSLGRLRELLVSHGWTWVTALCVMLFSLMHWPCGTTCLTIKNETQSRKWTLISFLVPTAAGILICFITANVARMLGLV